MVVIQLQGIQIQIQIRNNIPITIKTDTVIGNRELSLIVPSETLRDADIEYLNTSTPGDKKILRGWESTQHLHYTNLKWFDIFNYSIESINKDIKVDEENEYAFFSKNPLVEGDSLAELKRMKRLKRIKYSSKYLFEIVEDEENDY